jgi:hypothetical protein
LDAGVFFGAPHNGVSDFEVVMHYTTEGSCVGAWKLLRRKLTDWAKRRALACGLSTGGDGGRLQQLKLLIRLTPIH